MRIQMGMIRTVIVDDDSSAREFLYEAFQAEHDIEIVGECTNGLDAIESIREYRPDLLFLDIQIPELDGFDVLKSIDTVQVPYIVIITSHKQYALKAFDYFAIDYLLKPLDADRLARTLDRVRRLVYRNNENGSPEKVHTLAGSNNKYTYPERFMVKLGNKIILNPA